MSQEIINVGEAPNDGAGDPLRVAFIKTHNNFSTLFATGGITGIANGTSNLQIPVANGAIRMAVGNVANIVVVTSGGLTVTGNSSISGTAALGNGLSSSRRSAASRAWASAPAATRSGGGSPRRRHTPRRSAPGAGCWR